jgi:hypothetical protein
MPRFGIMEQGTTDAVYGTDLGAGGRSTPIAGGNQWCDAGIPADITVT